MNDTQAPAPVTLTLGILRRIVAVHTAGYDRDADTPLLKGVCIRPWTPPSDPSEAGPTGHGICVVATDGKLLVEECFAIGSSGTAQWPGEYTISYPGIDMLKVAIKQLTARKLPDNYMVPVSFGTTEWGSPRIFMLDATIMCVHCVYPQYASAFDNKCEADGAGMIATVPILGLNAVYMKRIADLWRDPGDKDHVEISMDLRPRGFVLKPLSARGVFRRALLMPITLPG